MTSEQNGLAFMFATPTHLRRHAFYRARQGHLDPSLDTFEIWLHLTRTFHCVSIPDGE